jgi:cysteine desulfurase
VADAVKAARRQVQELVGAAFDHEIVFTSGGTESDNAAILSALETQTGRDEVVTSMVEHPAVLALCEFLEKRRGVKVHRLPVDGRGRLDLDAYRQALNSKTAIVSFMWANNETGTIFPVGQLAAMAHEAGALFHTDAVQAAGKVEMQLQETAVDMASLSAHKLHGPKGIGALYVRKGVRFAPLVRGGRQERGRRAGTENAPGIVGFGKAAELAVASRDERARIGALRDRLQDGLLARFETAIVVGDVKHRLTNTLNIAFESLESEAILLLLDRQDIAASSGSACAAGSMEPSHVLRAMKLPYTAAHGAIRFSFSRDNTIEDVDRVLAAMPPIVEKLRNLPAARAGAAVDQALDSSYA